MLGPIEAALVGILLVVLMLGMGTTLTPSSFRAVARAPRAFLIGTASQFVFMPLLAFALSHALSLPNEAAIGLVLIGCCPGGTTSNLFAHLSRADVALSVSMTAASKVLCVVTMPVCLYLLARPFTTAEMSLPYGEIVKTLVVLLVPVAIGMGVRARFGERVGAILERAGSACGVAVLVLLVGVSVVRNGLELTQVPLTFYVAAISLALAGMTFGWLASGVGELPRAQRLAIAFETGVQNSPLAFAIIIGSFSGETQSATLRLPLMVALFTLLEAGLVTGVLRARAARAATGEAAVQRA